MGEAQDVAATRRSYDEGAVAYVQGIGTSIGPATETEVDRSILVGFGDAVRSAAVAPRVADVGCGPGRAAAFLRAQVGGLEVVGIDLSLALLRAGRSAHPWLPSAQGVLAALPLRASSFVGVVSWYSIIHTPPAGLPAAGRELARVVEAGGHVMVAFQAGGGESLERAAPTYRHDPEVVSGALERAGLQVVDRTVRPAELPHERSPQAFILGRRRSGGSGTRR